MNTVNSCLINASTAERLFGPDGIDVISSYVLCLTVLFPPKGEFRLHCPASYVCLLPSPQAKRTSRAKTSNCLHSRRLYSETNEFPDKANSPRFPIKAATLRRRSSLRAADEFQILAGLRKNSFLISISSCIRRC